MMYRFLIVSLAVGPVANAADEKSSPWAIQSGHSTLHVGVVGTFAAGSSSARDIEGGTQLGGHDPNRRGFTVQGVDVNFTGNLESYLRAQANITLAMDASGHTLVELEEAFAETISLPLNLQLRAGQYLSEFGHHNPTHLHAWNFVDTPLVNGRFLGPDGLRNPGVRLAWIVPTPFHSDVFLGIQDSHGSGTASFRGEAHHHGDEEEELPLAFRHAENDRGVGGLGDLLFVPRYAVSFEAAEAHALTLGASAAFGPNSSGEEGAGNTDTQIYGIDFIWKWNMGSEDHDHGAHDHEHAHDENGGYPFLSLQTEAMLRKYEVGAFDWAETGEVVDLDTGAPAVLPGETLTDYGFYTQMLYGFTKGWVAGLRFDYLWGERAEYENRDLLMRGQRIDMDPLRGDRWRLSPNLTWFPGEFAKIRLQYNYDDRKAIGRDHSVWLQFEFVLGSHGAHQPSRADVHTH